MNKHVVRLQVHKELGKTANEKEKREEERYGEGGTPTADPPGPPSCAVLKARLDSCRCFGRGPGVSATAKRFCS